MIFEASGFFESFQGTRFTRWTNYPHGTGEPGCLFRIVQWLFFRTSDFLLFYHPLVERVWGPHPRWCCNSIYSHKAVGPPALQASAAWHGTRCADSSCSGWLMWEVLARRSWPGPNNRGERTDFRQAVLQFPFCYFCQLSAPSFSSSEQTRQTSVLQGTEYTGQGFCSVTFNLRFTFPRKSIGLPFHVHPPNLHFNKAFKLIAN